jgi:hypothetical protein
MLQRSTLRGATGCVNRVVPRMHRTFLAMRAVYTLGLACSTIIREAWDAARKCAACDAFCRQLAADSRRATDRSLTPDLISQLRSPIARADRWIDKSRERNGRLASWR